MTERAARFRRAGCEVRLGIRIALDAETSQGELSVFELSFGPAERSARHRHSREQETFLLLEGELTLSTEQGDIELAVGDVAVLARGTAHSFAAGQAGARFLIMATPGGLEQFFRDLEAGLPAAEAAARAGLEFLPD